MLHGWWLITRRLQTCLGTGFRSQNDAGAESPDNTKGEPKPHIRLHMPISHQRIFTSRVHFELISSLPFFVNGYIDVRRIVSLNPLVDGDLGREMPLFPRECLQNSPGVQVHKRRGVPDRALNPPFQHTLTNLKLHFNSQCLPMQHLKL